MPDNRVELSFAIARYLFDQARVLIGAGIGEDEVGNDLGFPGELDSIPSDTPQYEWANACIRFIRYLANQLGPAILDYQERDSASLRSILTDLDQEI